MKKKICILTTYDNDFFTPQMLLSLNFSVNFENIISHIVFVPGFKSIKRTFILLFLLNFKEIVEILIYKIKYFISSRKFNFNNIEKKFIKDINSEESIKFIIENNFDLIVSLNCNQIINKKVFDQTSCDFVNFHPGKLPNYRGLFTNFYSILNKESEVYLSYHKIDVGIDTGQLMRELKYPVNKKDTFFSLYKKLYLNKRSHDFIIDCIKNYDLYKNDVLTRTNSTNFSYHSSPSIKQIINFLYRH
jgi:folate-dependent phosphoribosylglycinamide formyltransferase PurN